MGSTRVNGVTYQGWWVYGDRPRNSQWRENPFRPPYQEAGVTRYRTPVTGGRWKIRKRPDHPTRPWYAHTEGKAKKWNRRWVTHAQASYWAHLVAEYYRDYSPFEADRFISRILQDIYEVSSIDRAHNRRNDS